LTAITTKLGAIKNDVVEHSRNKFVGAGLTGSNLDALKEEFGEELQFYRLLPDPTDPLSDVRTVNFMVSGAVTVLTRNSSEFVEVFNDCDEFFRVNGIRPIKRDGNRKEKNKKIERMLDDILNSDF